MLLFSVCPVALTIDLQAMPDPTTVTNALSFDIEDWFHLVGIKAVADPADWDRLPSLVVDKTHWILDTIAETNTRATFFILGWIAERYPRIPKMIAAAGHELATHSYWHQRVNQLPPEVFRDDLRRSIDAIEQPTGKKVLGFRAASFSIMPGTEWVFDVLLDLGIIYDASLFPARRDHGGYDCPRQPHLFTHTPSGRAIRELPMSVMAAGPLRLPFSGGGYMRLLPKALIRLGFDHFNGRGLPVVVYLHPRDFAPDGPRVPMPLRRRFKSYIGLRSTEDKLRMLLDRYRFDTCQAVLGIEDAPAMAAAS